MEDVVHRGRKHKLGILLTTHAPASISKAVLDLTNIKVAFGLSGASKFIREYFGRDYVNEIEDQPTGKARLTAKITTATRNGVLTVPIQAVTIRQQRELQPEEKGSKSEIFASFEKLTREQLKEEIQGVFVVRDGVATFVSVKTGIMGTTEVEITNGLEDGEEVVSGSYKALRTLKNGAKILVENKANGSNKNE